VEKNIPLILVSSRYLHPANLIITAMTPKQFALAILSPGANAEDVVSAANRNKVSIIDKQPYDPSKNYATLNNDQWNSTIKLLFVFNDGYSILADTEQKLRHAMQKIYALVN
jgi:hypothetical protein